MASALAQSFLGQSLNVAERTATSGALMKVQLADNYASVSFWGKIQGVEKDYLLAQTWAFGEQIQKTFYYSNDNGVSFAKLQPADAWAAERAALIKERFVGIPSHRYADPLAPAPSTEEAAEAEESKEEEPAQEDSDAPAVPPKRELNELERLSWAVSQIDQDTSIVPVGAYVLSPSRVVLANPVYKGLASSDASQLSSYALTRNTRSESTLRRIRQAGIANVTEFLDPLSEEQPKGAWVIKAEPSGLQFAVRSLQWPGFELKITCHDSRGHTAAYFGTGLKNEDLLFVL